MNESGCESYSHDIGLGILMHVLEWEEEGDEKFKIELWAEPRSLWRSARVLPCLFDLQGLPALPVSLGV